MRLFKPICLHCEKKLAKPLEGEYTEAAVIFCSQKCAARYAISAACLMRWCGKHRAWFHSDDGDCYDCVKAEYEAQQAELKRDEAT